MTQRLLHFIRLLRAHGVRISVSESLDALHSVAQVGLQDRDLLRLSLRTVLVKSQQDFATFDTLFEQFFTLPRRRKRRRGRRSPGGENGAGQHPDSQANGQSQRSPSQPVPEHPTASLANPQVLQQNEQLALSEDGRQGQEVESLQALEQSWRQHIEVRPLRLPAADAHDAVSTPVHSRIDRAFPPDQLADMYREVERLTDRLLTRRALRYRRARRGQLDLRRTVTQGLRSASEVPFRVSYRRRRIGKLRLVVLCDVSGSVWQASTFLLKLVHTLQSEFSTVRSLLFVNSVTDVTPLFRRMRFPEELDNLRHYPNLNLFGFSDFGRVFYQVYRDMLRDFNRDTVCLILGDARNNGFDPQAWTLSDIRQRCRRMIWLNPDPRREWNTGDSVLDAYAPYCDHVLEYWTFEHLAQAADLLLHQ